MKKERSEYYAKITRRPPMKTPKMILFDYGQTLIAEQKFDGVKGTEAVLQYAVRDSIRSKGICSRLKSRIACLSLIFMNPWGSKLR